MEWKQGIIIVETLKMMKHAFAYQILVAMPILYFFSSIHLLDVSIIQRRPPGLAVYTKWIMNF
jgi:hypothetical protein